MKRYLFLLVIAIFCLPNNSFAQDGPMLINAPRELQPVDPAKSAWNSTINYSNKSISSKPQKPSKPRVKVSYLRAAEVSTDEATGITTCRWNDGSSYVGETYRTVLHGMGTMVYSAHLSNPLIGTHFPP